MPHTTEAGSALIDELHEGSYKGVTFLISVSNITGGRKDVLHSFPNSNRQTVEDLGLRPRVYNVTAIINADIHNQNYIQRRDAFLTILEQGGVGTLVHPFYGQLDNIVARNWTLVENLTELGRGSINIVFTVSDDLGVPVRSQNTLSVIEQSNSAFLAAINTDLAAQYKVDPRNLNSFTDAIATLNEVVDEFRNETSFLQAAADQIDSFTNELNDFEANITSLIVAPQNLADSITSLFTTVGNLYPTVEATADVLAGFFDFNDDKVTRTQNTTSRIERTTNDNIVKATVQNMSLGLAYFNTAQIDFETVTDIETKADELELQYQKVIAAEGLQETTKAELKDLRDEMQKFFDQQRLTARQLINVDTNLTTARLLSYQYYGDSDQGEQIADLNNTDDVSFIEGNVIILTA